MITFTIGLLIVLILATLAIALITVGGAAFIAIFADLIVCIAIIILILRLVSRHKKNKR